LITLIGNCLIADCFNINYFTYCVTCRQYPFQLMLVLLIVTKCFLKTM